MANWKLFLTATKTLYNYNYPHSLKFAPDFCMTQKMCFKAVDTHFVTDQYNTQEMCDKIVFDDPFKAKDYHDRYHTQEMCNKAVDGVLPVSKFFPDWLTIKRLKTSCKFIRR